MKTVIDAVIQIEAGGLDKFQSDLTKAASNAVSSIDYVKMDQGFTKVGEKFAGLLRTAAKLDIDFDLQGIAKVEKQYRSQMMESVAKIARYNEALSKDFLKKTHRDKMERLVKEHKAKIKSAQQEIDLRLKGEKDLQDAQKSHLEFMQKGMAKITTETAEGFGKAAENLIGNIKSGDLGGIFKGMGGGMKKGGKGAMNAGKAMGGKAGKLLGGVGKVMTKLGPALLVIGGVATAVIGLVKAIGAVQDKAFELNKEILNTHGAAEMAAGGFGQVAKSLRDMRKAAVDNQWALGAMADEQIRIVGAFGEAGVMLREMTVNIENSEQAMRDYGRATSHALAYSRLLGENSAKVATDMASYMEDLGLTIEGVATRFAEVTKHAQESGFGVKRFFSMVIQATSGMSMYNVRLSEAAALLVRIGKILGSKVGGDFLDTLGKGFVNESMQDRIKRVKLTGTKRTKRIMTRSRENTANSFGTKMQEAANAGQLGGDSRDGTTTPDWVRAQNDSGGSAGTVDYAALGDQIGLTGFSGSSADDLAQAIAATSGREQAQLISAFEGATARTVERDDGTLVTETNDEMTRQLQTLVNLAQGSEGGLTNMAAHLDDLDMGGVMNMMMNSAKTLFPGKELYELSAIQLAAVENSTGISGEQLRVMRRLSQQMDGDFQELQRIALEQTEVTDQTMREQIAQFGGFINENGQFVAGAIVDDLPQAVAGATAVALVDTNAAGDKVAMSDAGSERAREGFVQAIGSTMDDAVAAGMVDENLALSREIAENTFSLSNYMESGIGWIMERLYGAVEAIKNWLFGKDDDGAARVQAGEELRRGSEGLATQDRALRGSIQEKRRGLRTEEDPEKRRAIEAEITALEGERENVRVDQVLYRDAEQRVNSPTTDFSVANPDTVLRTIGQFFGAERGSEMSDQYRNQALQQSTGDTDLQGKLSAVSPTYKTALEQANTTLPTNVENATASQISHQRANMSGRHSHMGPVPEYLGLTTPLPAGSGDSRFNLGLPSFRSDAGTTEYAGEQRISSGQVIDGQFIPPGAAAMAMGGNWTGPDGTTSMTDAPGVQFDDFQSWAEQSGIDITQAQVIEHMLAQGIINLDVMSSGSQRLMTGMGIDIHGQSNWPANPTPGETPPLDQRSLAMAGGTFDLQQPTPTFAMAAPGMNQGDFIGDLLARFQGGESLQSIQDTLGGDRVTTNSRTEANEVAGQFALQQTREGMGDGVPRTLMASVLKETSRGLPIDAGNDSNPITGSLNADADARKIRAVVGEVMSGTNDEGEMTATREDLTEKLQGLTLSNGETAWDVYTRHQRENANRDRRLQDFQKRDLAPEFADLIGKQLQETEKTRQRLIANKLAQALGYSRNNVQRMGANIQDGDWSKVTLAAAAFEKHPDDHIDVTKRGTYVNPDEGLRNQLTSMGYAQDFIYQGDSSGTGKIWSLPSNEELMGIRSGGAVDRLIGALANGGGAGGGGGSGTFTVMINNKGDEQRAYDMVVRALQAYGLT